MGFLERFQKIKGIQEAADAAAGVLNQTTTGRVGGNLGKIEPELQAPIVNPGSVADGDKNPANLVKQQLATTEKPAIAAAVKIEKEKKEGEGAEGAAAPVIQTVTEGGTNVAQGGTKTDVKTDEQKKANDEALRTAGVASMQKTLTPTFATGRDKVSEFQEMIANQEQESDRLKRAEDRAERRKENLKAIYGILNGAGAALAGRKGLQTGAKEEGEKVIKNIDDQFTKRMAKAREDLKEKQARELKAYMLKREDAKQKKEDAYKKRQLDIMQQNADSHTTNANTNSQKAEQAARTLESMGIDWTQLDFTKKYGGLDLSNVPASYVDKIIRSISSLAGAQYGFTNANANMIRANAAATRAENDANGTITTRTEQVFVPDYNSLGERVGGHFETREIKTEKSPANGSGGAWKPNGNNSKGAWKPNK